MLLRHGSEIGAKSHALDQNSLGICLTEILSSDSVLRRVSIEVKTLIFNCQMLAFHRPSLRDSLEDEAFVLNHGRYCGSFLSKTIGVV